MLQHPLLTRLLSIREGALNVDFDGGELKSTLDIAGRAQQPVKYVDWYIPRAERKENIVLLVRGLDGRTSTRTLPITEKDVQGWINRMFVFPKEAIPPLERNDANAKLREPRALIQDLLELTDEEDLLILSPSGVLAQVPIHALRFHPSRTALIERNPILYSSNAAIFRQCHMRAAVGAGEPYANSQRATLIAVYDGDSEEAHVERDKIYDHVETLKRSFDFDIFRDSEATKNTFKRECQDCRWAHYHGHFEFNKRDVLQSGLILSKGDLNTTGEDADSDNGGRMTVADIFTMDITKNAPHVTLIACNSGTQDMAPGDEPLGIIPALLYAGATSVLGTLWPVDSRKARIFSELFYKEIARQLETKGDASKPRIVDLAHAVRTTIRRMMDRGREETRQPIHWASYVLYGSWFILPGGD